MARIDGDRLLADLRKLAEFGKWKTGVHRPTYTPQDMQAREWLASRMSSAGLDPEIDGIGNVIGRTRVPGPRLLIGSHVETQPHSGWLDGAMGVIFGLEVARALPGLPVDVVGWADEEGHFLTYLGSRSFTGILPDTRIDALANRDDRTPLRTALARAGLEGRERARLDPSLYRGYLEAHIEQGNELDITGDRIGVVTAIVGIENYRVEFTGQQNHAGTTQMFRRKDAGIAMIRFAEALYKRFGDLAGPRTVWTFGRIHVEPGAPSIVPGRAEMSVQFRDTDPDVLLKFRTALEEAVAAAGATGPCAVAISKISQTIPKQMDPQFQDTIESVASRHAPGRFRRMPSGAGHDAAIMAEVLRTSMLFVPSIDGISHHHTENTHDEDLVLGCAVLADAAEEILRLPETAPSPGATQSDRDTRQTSQTSMSAKR